MNTATELKAAADKIRDLATRTNTTLDRHEAQWTDLTVSDTAAKAKARPMVWSQYAAAMHPGVGLALAAWLESWDGIDLYEAGSLPEDARHALAVARAINAA